MTEKMSGARATVEALEREKVEYIFGMPGGANLPFYDALWDSKIKHVLVRHEQAAAHMADAYGRVSRKGRCVFSDLWSRRNEPSDRGRHRLR